MKILFVLHAPKKVDGVGDYTAILAHRLTEMGHQIAILGLSEDPSITGIQQQQLQGTPLVIAPWSPFSFESQNRIRKWMQEFGPDWVSLQFVNYAWNNKGIVFHILPAFKRLFSGFRVHIYFHEIWVGYFPHSLLKKRLVGFIQKIAITFLTRILHPEVIHTNSSFQQQELEKVRFQAKRNPLFGNVPFVDSPDFSWIYRRLQEWNPAISPAVRTSFLFIGLFGNLTGAIHNKTFYEALKKFSREKGVTPVFLFIGIMRADGQVIFEGFRKQFAEFGIFNLGKCSVKEISEVLQFIDFSCATSPHHLIEKSGTFAALVEHATPTFVFESMEAQGLPAHYPPNARLFRTEDDLLQLQKRTALSKPNLLERHAKFFFDSLVFSRV